MTGTVRAVFSWTVIDGGVLRHLSVSSLVGSGVPHPTIILTLAHYFGFTGATGAFVSEPPDDWELGIHEHEACAVVAQRVEGRGLFAYVAGKAAEHAGSGDK